MSTAFHLKLESTKLNKMQKLIDLPIKSIGAPHKLINTFMHSVCPLDAAQCSAVNPSLKW